MKQANLFCQSRKSPSPQRHAKSGVIQPFYNQNQHGYTLVELMVIVTALGILISMAIPAYSSFTQSSREMQATTQILKIAMKLEHHYNKTMSYQTSLASLALPDHDRWFRYRIESNHHKRYQVIASPLVRSNSQREFRLNQHGLHQHRVTGSSDWLSGWS